MEDQNIDNFGRIEEEELETEADEVDDEEVVEIEDTQQDEPDKFKGKTREDVIKSYVEQEKLRQRDLAKLEEKAEEKAREILKAQGKSTEQEKAELDKVLESVHKEIEDIDWTKLNPKDYTRKMIEINRKISEASMQEQQRKAQQEEDLRNAYLKDIEQATRIYPILKDNSERGKLFKELVIATVSESKRQGDVVSVQAATKKVADAMGVKPNGLRPKVNQPKALERTQPTTMSSTDTDEQKVQKGIIKAGMNSGVLGGL